MAKHSEGCKSYFCKGCVDGATPKRMHSATMQCGREGVSYRDEAPTGYKVNGRVVTREEFGKGGKGITAGRPPMTNSFTSFVSPIDGSVIDSAVQLRNHEKKHNVVQVGDAYDREVNNLMDEAKHKEALSKSKQD